MSDTVAQTDAHLARMFTVSGPALPPGATPPCTESPDDWFPPAGTNNLTAHLAIHACRGCLFRVECFTWAADPANGVRDGIWGGFSFARNSPDEKFIDAYRAAVWPTTPKENAA